jgi:DNA-binding transcriptional LysR family regulator
MDINVSLRHLRCFLAVANSGSFTVASSRMFLTQSSLTATIQQFERMVGVRLFDRTTRRVVMTEEGLRFRDEAEKIVKEFDSAIRDLQALGQSQQGHIRIAAAASVIYQFLVQAISVFRKTYPNMTISLRDAGAEKAEQMVLGGEVDLAITSKHKGLDDLDYTPLLEDRYGVVCLPEYPLKQTSTPLRWSDLPPSDYVAFSGDTGIGSFLAANAGHTALFAEQHDEVSSTTSLYALLSLGDRYSIIPALAANAGETPALTYHELCEPALTREICVITRRLRSVSPSAKRLLDILFATLEAQELPPGVTLVKRRSIRADQS